MSEDEKNFELRKCQTCDREYKSEKDFFKNTSAWRICSNKFLWFNCSCGSTMLIPRGKFSWYSPEKHLSPNASTVFNQLGRERRIPYVNTTVEKIRLMINQKRNLKYIHEEISKETLLSDQLIRIVKDYQIANEANTNDYPTLQHSLNYLGQDNIYDFLLSSFMSTIELNTTKFLAEKFWSGCYQTGRLACILNALVKLPLNSEILFIIGSNCHIGKIVLAIYFPDKTDKIWEIISNPKTQCTWKEAEHQIVDFDSNVLGEIAGALWGLSPQCLDVIRNHNLIGLDKNEPNTDLINIISLSSMIHYWIRNQPHLIEKSLFKARLKYFDLTESDLSKFISLKMKVD